MFASLAVIVAVTVTEVEAISHPSYIYNFVKQDWGEATCNADLSGLKHSDVSSLSDRYREKTVFIQINGSNQDGISGNRVNSDQANTINLVANGVNSFCFGGDHTMPLKSFKLRMNDSRLCVMKTFAGQDSTLTMVNSAIQTTELNVYRSTVVLENVGIGGYMRSASERPDIGVSDSKVTFKAPWQNGDPIMVLHIPHKDRFTFTINRKSVFESYGGFRLIPGIGFQHSITTIQGARVNLCEEGYTGSDPGYLLAVRGFSMEEHSSLKIDCGVKFIIHGYPGFFSSLNVRNTVGKSAYCVFISGSISDAMTIDAKQRLYHKNTDSHKYTIGCGATIDDALSYAEMNINPEYVREIRKAVEEFDQPEKLVITEERDNMKPCPSGGQTIGCLCCHLLMLLCVLFSNILA